MPDASVQLNANVTDVELVEDAPLLIEMDAVGGIVSRTIVSETVTLFWLGLLSLH